MLAESTFTAHVAQFITHTRLTHVPPEVIHLAKRSMLDGLGLALAGNAAESGHIVREYLKSQRLVTHDTHGIGKGNAGSTIIGSALKAAPRFAAFANGIAIHADGYDGTQAAVANDRVHGLLNPTAPTLPPVLALGEAHNRSGLEVLLAYLIAVEVESKMAESISMWPLHDAHSLPTIETIGALGAAAGAARILRLNHAQTCAALGMGAGHAAGLRANFGRMTQPFQAGRAAECGVVAAELIQLGWKAAPNALEANSGCFHTAGGADPGAIDAQLGNPWTFAIPGIAIQPYPSCAFTHPAIRKMLGLIRKFDIRPAQVQKIKISTDHPIPDWLIHHVPMNACQAKFSMAFCMAIVLLERAAGLAQFTDAAVQRTEVRRMMEKIDCDVHPQVNAAGSENITSLVEIQLNNGRTVNGRSSVGNAMSDDELINKFHECAAWGKLPRLNAEMIVEWVLHLEQLPRIRELTRWLASDAKLPRTTVAANHSVP